MSEKKEHKGIYILAFILILSGVGFLLYSGVSKNSVYFLNVSEALAMSPTELDQARLFGKVAADNVQRQENSLGVSFDLIDKKDSSKSIRVYYAGAVPDTFDPGVEVIVEGGFKPESHFFNAQKLMTKCPSKYEKDGA